MLRRLTAADSGEDADYLATRQGAFQVGRAMVDEDDPDFFGGDPKLCQERLDIVAGLNLRVERRLPAHVLPEGCVDVYLYHGAIIHGLAGGRHSERIWYFRQGPASFLYDGLIRPTGQGDIWPLRGPGAKLGRREYCL